MQSFPLSALTPGERAKLDRGEVLIHTTPEPGYKTPRLITRAVINHPPSAVFELISNPDRYSKTMPRIKEMRQVKVEGDIVHTKMTVQMPFPVPNLSALTEAVHKHLEGEVYVREWKLLEGDYKVNRGSWHMSPFDDAGTRTYLVYQVHVEPKVPLPNRIKSAVQQKAMPKVIQNLRNALG